MDAESFDHYTNGPDTATGVASRWIRNTTGSFDENIVAGRFGGQALEIATIGSTNPRVVAYSLETETPGGSPIFRGSVAFRRGVGSHNPSFLGVSLTNALNRQIGFRFLANRSIALVTGNQISDSEGAAATLFTSPVSIFSLAQWHTLNFRGLIHPSAGWVEFMVDGDADRTYMVSGVDTEGLAGTDEVTRIAVSGNGPGPGLTGDYSVIALLAIDDVVLELGENSAHLPECRIQQFPVTSDGGHLDLVPSTGVDHYAVVDEAPVSTADYLSGSANGEYDELNCADISVIPGSILAVQTVGFAAKTDVATRAWELGLISGGTTEAGAQPTLTTAATPFFQLFETDPDTGVAWTQPGVNAIQLKPTIIVP